MNAPRTIPTTANTADKDEYDFDQSVGQPTQKHVIRRRQENDRADDLEQDYPELSEPAIHDHGMLARRSLFANQEEQREHHHGHKASDHDIDMAI